MKTIKLFFLPMMLIFFTACEKDLVAPEDSPQIIDVIYSESSSVSSPQTITVKIEKPTPCHVISRVDKSIIENTYNYDIIIEDSSEACITVIEEENVDVIFDPVTKGDYIINFMINGKAYKTITVRVD